MRDLTWMSKYCTDYYAINDFSETFQLHHWHVATNGRVVCAIDSPEHGNFTPSESQRALRAVAKMLAQCKTAPAQQRTTLGDIWAWLDHCELRRCPDCNGTGFIWIDTEDGISIEPDSSPNARRIQCDCGGKLIYPLDNCSNSEFVRICGVVHSVPFLAAWLDPRLGNCGAQVDLCTTEYRGAPLGVFRGNGWLFISAGCVGYDAHMLRTYTPGAGEWYMIRHHAPLEVHPGTDWFIEQGYAEGDLVSMWGETAKPQVEVIA